MVHTIRKIIKIDEEKCNGCGQCLPSCHEGALQIVGGKAKLVRESYCDGLGACLGECPQGALSIEERAAEEFLQEPISLLHPWGATACPGSGIINRREVREKDSGYELKQWPVQLHLISPMAPFLQNRELVLVADCVPFVCRNFYDFLQDGAVAALCPKFDDISAYRDKLERIIESADIKGIKILHMEVPCCHGLVNLVERVLAGCARKIPHKTVMIGINGDILSVQNGQ